jgi:hypothetical protein
MPDMRKNLECEPKLICEEQPGFLNKPGLNSLVIGTILYGPRNRRPT